MSPFENDKFISLLPYPLNDGKLTEVQDIDSTYSGLYPQQLEHCLVHSRPSIRVCEIHKSVSFT